MKTLKPPRKVINSLISKTRKLIRGKTVDIEVLEYGVILHCDLTWECDETANLDSWDLSAMPQASDREKRLIGLIENLYDINHRLKNIFLKVNNSKILI